MRNGETTQNNSMSKSLFNRPEKKLRLANTSSSISFKMVDDLTQTELANLFN
jgi:hypothetical protein